ncbi:MAG: tRNA guanosine(34) transglycosylase Tgt [Patescibacteria group bacterium]
MFEILKKDSKSNARLGVLTTPHGEIHTPAFLPIGTKGAVKALTNEELVGLGAEIILANTYHLMVSPGSEIIRKAGGLHKFMNWDRPIFTDSGGYQVFSLGEKISSRPPLNGKGRSEGDSEVGAFNKKISEEGVTFQSGIDGREFTLTPEHSVKVQQDLGSDITVVLDEFTGEITNYLRVKETVERTTRWAKRSREALRGETSQLQYAVVQGAIFEDLRKQSALELREMDFDGYCIGGVAVGGETSEEQYKAVEYSLPHLPEDKPRHLLGVGTPEQIIEAVKRGIDTFDCVIPTREARHGKIYLGVKPLNSELRGFTPQTLDISKTIFKEDFTALDSTCDCEACTKYTRAYLHHLFKSSEILAMRLLTMHNVRFYLRLMEKIREAVAASG